MADMTVKAALVELASILAPKSPLVNAQIDTACDRPAAYVAQFKSRLAERAVTKPTQDLPLLALVDALVEHSLLAEIDVHAAPEDVLHAVERLASLPKKARAFGKVAKADDFDDLSASAVLARLEGVTSKAGWHLVGLDRGADAFYVVAVRDAQVIGPAVTAAGFRRLQRFAETEPSAIQSHADRMAAIEATLMVPNPVWRFFLKVEADRVAVWALKVAELAIDLSDSTLGQADDIDRTLRFERWEDTRAAGEREIADHLAQGFAEVSADEYRARHAAAKL